MSPHNPYFFNIFNHYQSLSKLEIKFTNFVLYFINLHYFSIYYLPLLIPYCFHHTFLNTVLNNQIFNQNFCVHLISLPYLIIITYIDYLKLIFLKHLIIFYFKNYPIFKYLGFLKIIMQINQIRNTINLLNFIIIFCV